MILEHHALRDEAWRQRTRPVYEAASIAGNRVETAAEFAGEENVFLESRRKQLYEENPPSREFEKWMRECSDRKSICKPPL
jgi:predicted metallo-beta-lactamase superfamily hydrolase